jgi:hypothetical protein
MSILRVATLALAFLFLCCPLAFGREIPWIEVRSSHFRVLSDGSARNALRVAREFEQMRTVFARAFPSLRLETGAPLIVLAPRDESSAKRLAPALWRQKGAKPAGYFQHGWEKQYAVVRLDEVAPGAYEIVYHEYVHSLLHMNFRWLPAWLDEGLAEFYGNTRFEQLQILVGTPSPRIGMLRSSALIPLDTLLAVNGQSPYYHDEDKVQVFYAESWALVHFLTFGQDMQQGKRLNEFYSLLQQGMDGTKAFQTTFGDLKEVQNHLDRYVHRLAMPGWVIKDPPLIDEKSFETRDLSTAETAAELGGYQLWSRNFDQAKLLISQALKDEPKLSLAHENMGFLAFADGEDEEAVREFSQAYELDGSRYLSQFLKTMLSPGVQSNSPSDQTALHDALQKTILLNPEFAPAYIQLARLAVRQGDLSGALALARKAEQLEPSRAGYHLLSGQIMLRMGLGAEAAIFAKYVAERWYGADHDEAIELWNNVPPAKRPVGNLSYAATAPEIKTVEGGIKSVKCGDKDSVFELTVDHGNDTLVFRGNGGWRGGFSDTLWYGQDHFSFCRHVKGLRVVVRYKTPSDKRYSGDLAEVQVREDLPSSSVVSKSEGLSGATPH